MNDEFLRIEAAKKEVQVSEDKIKEVEDADEDYPMIDEITHL